MGLKWWQRWNLHGYREYAAGRYWTLWLVPTLEITWIGGNKSLHFDLKVFLWCVKLNTFWQDEPKAENPLFRGIREED